MRKYAKHWRDSASLIIVARNHGNVSDADGYNYKVLVFKRTEKTSFLPNHIVFPGGAFDPQDETPSWLSYFRQQNVPDRSIQALASVSGPRPYIFQTTDSDTLDRNLSLRLCALREAFEELGVLLISDRHGKHPNGFSQAKKEFPTVQWQQAIHEGAKTFLELYGELNELPDIFGLYEWSVWITPTTYRQKRFETAFFLAALNEQVAIYPEPYEVAEYMWASPRNLLDEHAKGVLWLAPPQAYELQRLSHVYDIDELVEFARKRKDHGTTSFCPVGYNASDVYFWVLPGDDLFPEGYDFISANEHMNRYKELSVNELNLMARNLHRVENRGLNIQKYLHNGPPVDGHLHVLGHNRGTLKGKL
ncbi:acyl-coenzyme A diphosphatase NUDT19-like [Anopheles bellator]|uniref:acyl-coenzyme A diphosphatase NUDT19-like n=1 Tax=Anopheles bellator TaxID=139047 RepID=UPI0026483DA2|nr:acyl-coenzyme A diphosphatase NUDT19-like [Anopheles bellator]